MDNLTEVAQRITAARNRLWSAEMEDHPNYRDLFQCVRTVLAYSSLTIHRGRNSTKEKEKVRKRFGRKQTGRDSAAMLVVLGIGALVIIALIARRVTDLSERVSGTLRAGVQNVRAASQKLIEQAQKRRQEPERSPRDELRSIIRESVRRSAGEE